MEAKDVFKKGVDSLLQWEWEHSEDGKSDKDVEKNCQEYGKKLVKEIEK